MSTIGNPAEERCKATVVLDKGVIKMAHGHRSVGLPVRHTEKLEGTKNEIGA